MITGGTSPYSIYWTGGQRTQTLSGIGPGYYGVTVVDYYGDYTATTTCFIGGPTPNPTSSPTPTPTITPSRECPSICIIGVSGLNSIGPWLFTCNGDYNGKTKWTYQDANIIWIPTRTRWEMVQSDLSTPYAVPGGTGIFISTDQTATPLASWGVAGGTSTWTVTATQGKCPTPSVTTTNVGPNVIPLQATVTSENNSCSGGNCDGNIVVSASFGTPPYQYSINNGTTFQSSNFFFNVCPNTYTVITKDASNSVVSNSVTISNNSNPTTYQLLISKDPDSYIQTNGATQYQSIATQRVTITTNPPLPQGITLSFVLTLTSQETVNGPGSGVIGAGNTVSLNGNFVMPINSTSDTVLQNRPYCSPELQTVTTSSQQYPLTFSAGTTYLVRCKSIFNLDNGQISYNSCTTQLQQNIYASVSQLTINGCSCCNAITDETSLEVLSETMNYNQTYNNILE